MDCHHDSSKLFMQTANLQQRITESLSGSLSKYRYCNACTNRQLTKIEDTKQHVGPLHIQRNPKTEESTDINYCANFAERRALFTERFHVKTQL